MKFPQYLRERVLQSSNISVFIKTVALNASEFKIRLQAWFKNTFNMSWLFHNVAIEQIVQVNELY